jgi:hypothetical protein
MLRDADPLRLLAESTEASAIRDQFDLHNSRYVRILAVALLLFSFPATIAYAAHLLWLKAAGASVILVASVIALLITMGRGRALARRTAQARSEWLISLVFAGFVGFMTISYTQPQHLAIFASTTPWVVVFLWMPVGRRLVMHLLFALLLIVAIETTTAPLRMGRGEYYAPAFSSNVAAFLAGAFFSRRARRRIVALWSERHAQAVEQLRMRDELQLAREMQLSMLPEAPPSIPWLDVAAVSLPATEVGGDYYDYFRVGERLALVCGDVAGHGLASGIVLTALRSGFTLLRDSLADPAAVLTRLHDLVEQTSRRRMLATAAVVSIDPASRRARIASAGHPPVMLRSNGSVRSIELFGPPLGVRLPVRIAQTEVSVAAGDVFVLHSDGVYETTNSAGDLYGLDRLASLISHAGGSADDVLRAIVDDVNAFRGGAAQDDDLTIVVAVLR